MTRESASRIARVTLPVAIPLTVLSLGATFAPLQHVASIALVAFALTVMGVRRS